MLFEVLFSDWVGILSFITVAVSIIIVSVMGVMFVTKSGKKSDDQ
jgi:hypothetical protein